MTVQFSGATKRYGSEYALRDFSFRFDKGKIYGLLGPNGSGKSTALKMAAGLVYPSAGTVAVDGERVTRKICRKVAYLTELDMFYESFTVKQMVSFYRSQFPDFDPVKAQELLRDMGLPENKKMKQLSKGNRGRLKLVLALARNVPVILLDEPFSGLDALVRESIVNSLLNYINFHEQTVIIATHEIDELEPILDEVVAIRRGRFLDHQVVEALRENQGLSVAEWYKRTIREKGSEAV
ncbi:ABC transporter ATP-binding protein [Caldibacillus debilis]|uniref:ABC transporter ATP-binding protein n=1 Tax=Caldibacillus debilis TaxID=301148 RepID=UPI000377BC6C|nr:ABC transporter ATP-binding protein [Caldibacillus debilis]